MTRPGRGGRTPGPGDAGSRRSALLLVALAACGDPQRDAPREVIGSASAGDKITGTFSVGGAPQTILACNAGHGEHVFVELLTTSGRLRFEDQNLYWTTDTAAIKRGDKLTCAKLDRSWGGGTRADDSSYFRGMLDFRCTLDTAALAGNVTIDCGNITAPERAQLDANRKTTLDQQRGSGSAR